MCSAIVFGAGVANFLKRLLPPFGPKELFQARYGTRGMLVPHQALQQSCSIHPALLVDINGIEKGLQPFVQPRAVKIHALKHGMDGFFFAAQFGVSLHVVFHFLAQFLEYFCPGQRGLRPALLGRGTKLSALIHPSAVPTGLGGGLHGFSRHALHSFLPGRQWF